MFCDEIDKTELRQGDMIQGVCYPAINRETLALVGRFSKDDSRQHTSDPVRLTAISEQKSGLPTLTAQVRMRVSNVIVLSQCCDCSVTTRAGKPVYPRLLVAPVFRAQHRIEFDRVAAAKANGLDDFVNLYYLAAYPPLLEDYIADFSWMVSLTEDHYFSSLDGKIMQLLDEERIKLKLKLGNYLARPTAEEQAAGIYPG